MKVGSLVREEIHAMTPWRGRQKSFAKYRVGIVIKVDEFQTSEDDEISDFVKGWLSDMGPRVQVYWSDCLVTVQPGTSLEVLS